MRGKRLALVLGVGLLAVVATTAASMALLTRTHERALRDRAELAAHELTKAYARDASAVRARLQQVCARDALLEKLALEGAAGESMRELASGLARVLEADVWLLVERGGVATVLGASAPPPRALPTRDVLNGARERPLAFAGARPLVLTTCTRGLRGETLYVVRAEPLDTLRARLAPSDRAVTWVEQATTEDTSALDHADLLALRIPGAEGTPDATLWLRASAPPRTDTLLAFVPPFLLLLAFGGLLAYFAAARSVVDEAALVTLEQAAERVARGDLTARIGPRAAGRADQTFRTFDRMTAELREMRARLAEAERAAAWQDMARRIAHEIKNPLSPIQMAIETLRKARDKQLPAFDEIFEESTRAILDEVRRMQHIVREFSEFAQLPRAKPGLLSVGALVDDTVGLYTPDDVQVTVLDESGGAQARVDRAQITQVLVNLLQNAIDAARTSARPAVDVRIEAGPSAVRVHVDDSGPGIAEAERERVFEPYFTTKEHGTGLGLAIVRRIVADHEGTVQVATSPLGGARFTLVLPRSEA